MSLWEDFLDEENFFDAVHKVNKSKNRKTLDAMTFNKDLVLNTYLLMNELESGSYKVSNYQKFSIFEPKERVIYAPSHRDKIVQIALNNVLKDVVFPRFIPDSYGSIDKKGHHRAADKIQYNMRAAKRKWSNGAYTVKLDIKKFFYTIDREILKSLFRKHISDKNILNLLDQITDSASVVGDKGIPLGNTISQLSSNIYLNELDQYLKRKHSLRYYVRYMDDVIIQVENKNKAKEVLVDAKHFVNGRLNLELNENKSLYFPIKNPVNAVGYKIWTTHKKLRGRSKNTLKKILKEEKDLGRLECRLASWMGLTEKASTYNFKKKYQLAELLDILGKYRNLKP